jgi:hypothetical protein
MAPAKPSSSSSKFKRWPWILVFLLLVLAGAYLAYSEPRPEGEMGPAADALARDMMQAVNVDAWHRTGAVRWSFRGQRHHLWDRQRQLAQVAWDDVEVLVNLSDQSGRAWQSGQEVSGEKADKLVRKAYEGWINDSFWLNPVVKVFDDGTERSLVESSEGRGLLVQYTSGGVTPGDAYLWIVGDDGLPVKWKMWTSNLPIGGMDASWEDWITLSTGAKVATGHKLAIARVDLEEVAGAATLEELLDGAADPFPPIL